MVNINTEMYWSCFYVCRK